MQCKRNFSAKREAIYQILSSTDSHPTAEWIYENLKTQIPDLSLGTVYRNLSVFKETGLVKSVGVINGHERFDANTFQHSHFVCNCCFKIIDIPKSKTFVDQSTINNLENECDVHIQNHNITFYGLCGDCSKKISVESEDI